MAKQTEQMDANLPNSYSPKVKENAAIFGEEKKM